MKLSMLLSRGAIGLLAFAACAAPSAQAADFYQGKTLQLYVGFGPGGSYDTYARVVAEHIGRHIPGEPRVVAMNMEGAGSLRLANWLYHVAPKDGTVFGITSRAAPFAPLIGAQGGPVFEANKFTWIGSANNEVSTCVAWNNAGIKSFDQLFTTPLIIGGDGPNADGEQFGRVMNDLFGTKIKIVSGYPGGNAINLAMERGEVHGRCGWSWSGIKAERKSWIDDAKINVFVQIGLSKHPDLPNVPSLSDYAKTEEQKQILRLVLARQPLGRPFFAPPGVPADRATILQNAFMAMMKDPKFLAAAEKAQLEINPLSGPDVATLVNDVVTSIPPDVVKKTRDILTRN